MVLQKIFLIFAFFVLIECKHPILYEISTRPWLYELSNKYNKPINKLRDIPLEEFDYLRENGVDIVWMMGVWKLGQYGLDFDRNLDFSNVLPDITKEDIIGSPYAVVEYTCNPEIGTNKDLIWLKEQLNSRDLKLMLDFVPNHSAFDAPTASNPKLYIRAPEGKVDPERYSESGFAFGRYNNNNDPWEDVIQFNYWEEETRKIMKDNLMTVLSYADGVRCDVAGLILNDAFEKTWKEELNYWGYKRPDTEFWEIALKEVKKKYPNAILLAEVFEDYQIKALFNFGFAYTYNKDLLIKMKDSADVVNSYIQSVKQEYWNHATNYVENHDEDRIVYAMADVEKAKAAGTIAATIGGMIFINHGQWSGYKNKLEVHLRRGYGEDENEDVKNYYQKLMKIIQDPAFTGDEMYPVTNLSGKKKDEFVAYIRVKGVSYYLVVVNYSNSFGCAYVPIFNIEGRGEISINEAFKDLEYIRVAENLKNKGLFVCLDPWKVQIFKYNYN
jgi:glycosidase